MEQFDRIFSIEILEKAFHALRVSFLREHKKHQKGKLENCRIKVGHSTKACFSWKTRQRPVKWLSQVRNVRHL